VALQPRGSFILPTRRTQRAKRARSDLRPVVNESQTDDGPTVCHRWATGYAMGLLAATEDHDHLDDDRETRNGDADGGQVSVRERDLGQISQHGAPRWRWLSGSGHAGMTQESAVVD